MPKQNQDLLALHRQVHEDEAADFLALDCRTLTRLRREGGGPKFVRVSRSCVRYRVSDLIAWQESKLRASTAEDRTTPAAA